MNKNIHNAILQFTGASGFEEIEVIQSLWSGYGKIIRLRLFDAAFDTVVAKYVSLPGSAEHPRGWNTDLSHQRKMRSYQVESHWYSSFAERCDETSRVAGCLGVLEEGDQFIMVLEDLDAAGFAARLDYSANISEQTKLRHMRLCIRWLANFHAKFLQLAPFHPEHKSLPQKEPLLRGLWQEGSYWHLATRPDEYTALPEGCLKHYAAAIDAHLSMCPWQTLIHGDAKLANFCFAENVDGDAETTTQLATKLTTKLATEVTTEPKVAAVDFQYVGVGCGMKDVAYFISSCLEEADCERLAPALLDDYFIDLRQALANDKKDVSPTDVDQLEQSWRELYPFAWADFYRFLQGWSPSHWKLHTYSERLTRGVLESLELRPQSLEQQMSLLLHNTIKAARAAAAVIAQNRDRPVDVMQKGLGGSLVSDVVTEVDLQCQALIASHLAPVCQQFGIAFVGEESDDHSARLNAAYSWLVDPIDGTLPFIEQREGYAVSIGLINQEGEPLLGVVVDAYHDKLYAVAQGCEPQFTVPDPELDVSASSAKKLRCFLDAGYEKDSRYESVLTELHEYAIALGLSGVERITGLGGALNACRTFEGVASNTPSLFLKLPKEKGGSLWDYAASAAIFAQQGLPVSDIFGKPLDLNRRDSTYLNHRGVLYASDAALADYIIEKLRMFVDSH